MSIAVEREKLDQTDIRKVKNTIFRNDELVKGGYDPLVITGEMKENGVLKGLVLDAEVNEKPMPFQHFKADYLTLEGVQVTKGAWQGIELEDSFMISSAKLKESVIQDVTAQHIEIEEATISHTEFSELRTGAMFVSGSNFTRSTISYSDLTNADFLSVSFKDGAFKNNTLDNAVLNHVTFSNTEFENVDFTLLSEANEVHFENCRFKNCSLDLSKYVGFKLDEASKSNLENSTNHVKQPFEEIYKVIQEKYEEHTMAHAFFEQYHPNETYEITFADESQRIYVATFKHSGFQQLQPQNEELAKALQKPIGDNILAKPTTHILYVNNEMNNAYQNYKELNEGFEKRAESSIDLSEYAIDELRHYKEDPIHVLKIVDKYIDNNNEVLEMGKRLTTLRKQVVGHIKSLTANQYMTNVKVLSDMVSEDKNRQITIENGLSSTNKVLQSAKNILINDFEHTNKTMDGLKRITRNENMEALKMITKPLSRATTNNIPDFANYNHTLNAFVKGQIIEPVKQVKHYLTMVNDIQTYINNKDNTSYTSNSNKVNLLPYLQLATNKAMSIALENGLVKESAFEQVKEQASRAEQLQGANGKLNDIYRLYDRANKKLGFSLERENGNVRENSEKKIENTNTGLEFSR